mmetsp:Transcript_27716/g.82617  ORF Transcript_27716/g.82617 Transcript_27716/m.82617 type:complete len:1078 (+) Transcript_27716:90-3323(+)
MGKKATPAADATTAPATKPKAEAKPKPAEPKAKADPAPAKAKAAATPAAPAAKGAAKAGAAAPKAKAAGKAAAAPPAAATPAPKAAAAKGAAAPAKAGVPKGGAKAAAAPPAGKAKAKAVPKAVVPPPEEEPEDDDGDFEVKKKKNRRGGQKKKEADDGPEEQQVSAIGMPDEAHLSKVASKAAEAAAEQDEDLLALRVKVKAAEEAEKGKTGAGNFASINDEIEKVIAKKKADMPKKAQPSHKCQMQIEELKVLMKQGQDIGSMLSEMEGKFVEAKKAECAKALCTKLSFLQEKVQTRIAATKTVKSIYANAPSAPAAAAADAPAGMSAASEERLEKRLKEKAATKGVDADAAMVKETLELSPDIMKYLFNMPECFKLRFEKESMVLIDPIRGPKGAGKGKGKDVTPKEFVVAGLSQGEVDKVVGALKALDFSGTQMKEIKGSVMSRYEKVKEIEGEFKVMAYKNREQLTLYGSKANVPKAFEAIAKADAANAEANKIFTVDVDLTADNLKVMKAGPGGLRNVLAAWKGDAETVRMKIPEFGEDDDGKPKKLRLSGKTQAEVDAVKKRVEDYVKSMASEFVAGDVSKVNGKGSNEAIRTAFKAIRDASAVRIDRKGDEGFQLMGPKKEIPAIKAKLLDLFKKADYEPAKVSITNEQRRVFNEEKMQEISKKSGADVRRNNLNLVIVGDEGQVEKAQKEIETVIEKEGSVDSIAVTDETMKALTMSRATKLKAFQDKANTIISADPKTGTVSIVGSAKGVETTKKELEKFAAQIEKDQADMTAKEITVAMEAIPRIIGTGGSVLKNIRETTGVSVRVGRDDGTVEIKGVESAVATAEKMIMDIVNGAGKDKKDWEAKEAPAKRETAAKAPRKKAEEYKGANTDFPTLGGEVVDEAATTAAAKWGSGGLTFSKAKKEEAMKTVTAAESFPTLGGGKAPAKAAPAPAAAPKEEEKPAAAAPKPAEAKTKAEEEEEEACDIDDPFAMMGGMGDEIVYKVTAMEERKLSEEEEAAARAAAYAEPPKPAAQPKPEAAKPQEAPKVQPAAVPAAETEAEGFKGADDDFPSLMGAAPVKRRGGR